jgi:tetratricopeptide (TPR) repeat protein
MQTDMYDLPISTSSAAAAQAFQTGQHRLLGAEAKMVDAFEESVTHDPGFALGHAGLARARQFSGDMAGARDAINTARDLTGGISPREAGHIHALGLLVDGNGPEAYTAIRAHVADHPRDAVLAQTCSSVFGLIGFSGQPGREAELLAYNASLLPHYGEDWWCLSQYAFALCETGQLAKATGYIDRSLAINPDNANGAHVRSHILYEAGDTAAGRSYLANWVEAHDRNAVLHGHLSWHVALWSLEQGDAATMWAIMDADVAPDTCKALPINVLTDTASLLFRAEAAGVTVAPARWHQISEYATRWFPKSGNAFVDIHAALAHAMAGNAEALSQIITAPKGPAADLVPDLAEGFAQIAADNWAAATAHLTAAMADHARIGGSRAQRDLLELALLTALLRQGRAEEARHITALRRPVLAGLVDRAA